MSVPVMNVHQSPPRPHRLDCPGAGNGCTLWNGLSPAQTCRDRGWAPGTVLAGDEGYGLARIRVLAIGEKEVFVRHLAPEGGAGVWEGIHLLCCRCWGVDHDYAATLAGRGDDVVRSNP